MDKEVVVGELEGSGFGLMILGPPTTEDTELEVDGRNGAWG